MYLDTLTKRNDVHGEMRRRTNCWNGCYSSVRKLLSSSL